MRRSRQEYEFRPYIIRRIHPLLARERLDEEVEGLLTSRRLEAGHFEGVGFYCFDS